MWIQYVYRKGGEPRERLAELHSSKEGCFHQVYVRQEILVRWALLVLVHRCV